MIVIACCFHVVLKLIWVEELNSSKIKEKELKWKVILDKLYVEIWEYKIR